MLAIVRIALKRASTTEARAPGDRRHRVARSRTMNGNEPNHWEAARHRNRPIVVRTVEEAVCIGMLLLGVVLSIVVLVPPLPLLGAMDALRRTLS
jgi:hypothetical protein